MSCGRGLQQSTFLLRAVSRRCAWQSVSRSSVTLGFDLGHRSWQEGNGKCHAAAWSRTSAWPGAAWHLRGLYTTSDTTSVQSLLNCMQGTKLRETLDAEAQIRPFMTYNELLDLIIADGAADTVDEAHRRADALVSAGVCLRFNSIVYLRPQEISELIFRTLPTDPSMARRNLVAIEEELEAMDQQHRALRRHAQRWPRFWLWTGCTALVCQFGLFVYLTYWELSWDVIEPIAYFTSLWYSLMAYIYFLVRGSYFDYGPFEEEWTRQQMEKKMAERGFNAERYQHLMRTRERYKRYLQAAGDAAGAVTTTSGRHATTTAET